MVTSTRSSPEDIQKYIPNDIELLFLNVIKERSGGKYNKAIDTAVDEFTIGNIYDYQSAQAYIVRINTLYNTGYNIKWGREEIVNSLPFRQRADFTLDCFSGPLKLLIMCGFIKQGLEGFKNYYEQNEDFYFTQPEDSIFIMTIHARVIIDIIYKKQKPNRTLMQRIQSLCKKLAGSLAPNTIATSFAYPSHDLYETLDT